jgi:excisionase family DNA binding protein
MAETTAQYLSTAEAARMLGLSTTLVQSLVDKNELKGWKTRGGHRRISLQSIQDYQSQAGHGGPTVGRQHRQPKIMVVIESEKPLRVLQQACAQWSFGAEVKFVDSVTAALLDLSMERPDMLVVEMTMPRAQQEKTLLALDNFNARSRPISMVLVTEEKDLQLPTQSPVLHLIQVVPGPLSEVWLHAYLTGVVACFRT